MSASEEKPSQAHVVEIEKNPKRVAAGKALPEKNRKYKEHFEKTAGVTTPTPAVTEPTPSNNSTYFVVVIVA